MSSAFGEYARYLLREVRYEIEGLYIDDSTPEEYFTYYRVFADVLRAKAEVARLALALEQAGVRCEDRDWKFLHRLEGP
jgi:hypothetical protein